MKLKRLEGASSIEGLTTMLVLMCLTLLGLVLLYLVQPSVFRPIINILEEYFYSIINYFNK
jgi:hypothetical protein